MSVSSASVKPPSVNPASVKPASVKRKSSYFSAWRRLLLQDDHDAAALYDFFRPNGVHLAADGAPLLNMGYWRDIAPADRNGLERANLALFDMVIDGAGIENGDTVVDAGSGALSTSLRCARRTGAGRIVSLNICAGQNQLGMKRVRDAGLRSRLHVLQANATNVPLAAGSVDRVLSVEAAFHFEPRDNFFSEAARVLRIGGTLTLVDLAAPAPVSAMQRFWLSASVRGLQFPRVNVYDREEYARRITRAGFRIHEFRSIKQEVVPPFQRWFVGHPLIALKRDLFFEVGSTGFLFYPWDYVFLHAERVC